MNDYDYFQKPTHLPNVESRFIQNVGLFIVVDASLTIFSEDCSTVKSVMTFQYEIEVFTVTPCGSFVLVGLHGQLKCLHIQPQATELFTR